MTRITHLALVAAAGAGLMLAAPGGASAAKCVLAGGEATMVTEDLAKFMAEAALKNSISAHNWKPAGKVKMTCKTEVTTHCVAKQKACS